LLCYTEELAPKALALTCSAMSAENKQAICQPNASIALTSIDYKTIALLLC
jgi:hypothetical protein